jgi:dipeptidyl aminopeptidase/acylaminoacyl peptidase
MTNLPKTPLHLSDFYAYAQVTECVLSPLGDLAAYILKTPLQQKNEYTSNLFVVPSDGSTAPHPLSRGQRTDRMPRFSPDGSSIAILSARPPELADTLDDDKEEPRPQIWLYDLLKGGEPRQLTQRHEGIHSFCWMPDGARMVVSARTPSVEQAEYLKSIRDEKSPGPLVLTRVQHKTDEDGYLDNVETHLFILDLKTGILDPLTEGSASELDPVCSPDGQWILFRSNRTGDPDNNRRYDLWLISPETRQVRRLTHGDVEARHPAFSPDGQWVAFLSSKEPENNYALNRLWVVAVADAEPAPQFPSNLGQGWTSIGGIIADTVVGDPVSHARVYPMSERATHVQAVADDFSGFLEGPIRFEDRGHIVALASERAQSKLFRFNLHDKTYAVLYPRDESCGTVTDFDTAADSTVMLANHPHTGPECFRLWPDGSTTQLSRASSSWIAQRTTVPFTKIRYTDHDGQDIEAWVLTPPRYDGQQRLPLIVSIHGGPMSYEAPEFEFETQYWANRGYAVLLVNYRGSTSYGEDFCQVIRGRWGPMEHDDVMCGIDTLIERGWIDPKRLFCTGFSMGGIMTNWAVGHTDRFQAAVTEHGVWDYASAFGTDDCHLWWQDDLGVPWQNRPGYLQTSPASGLTNIRTPLLITAGEHDWRCPLSQAEQLYVSLKKRGVETELVIYPAEHHESDSRPHRAVDRLRRIDQWFARFGGIPTD